MSTQFDYDYFLSKCRSFCTFQDRSLREVKAKLQSWQLRDNISEKIIKTLKKEDVLNEDRFCRSFARGKFRINKWGKNRIMFELTKKGIPELMAQIGLDEIDEKEYQETIEKLIKTKCSELKKKDSANPKGKIARYMIAKGFESDLVWNNINRICK